MFHAKSGVISVAGGTMEYIRFGRGERSLVMLPGLGTSLRSIKGTELPMALMYRVFAKDFTVWAFNRIAPMPVGYSTRDMARDQAEAMEALGIGKADVFGVSMGGEASREIAARIPGAELKMYEQWGHGLYEEEREFNGLVLAFLLGGRAT